MFFTDDVGVLISSFPLSLYGREKKLDTYPWDTAIKRFTLLLMHAKTEIIPSKVYIQFISDGKEFLCNTWGMDGLCSGKSCWTWMHGSTMYVTWTQVTTVCFLPTFSVSNFNLVASFGITSMAVAFKV